MIQKCKKGYSGGQILSIGAFAISILLLGIALNLNTALHSNYSAIESINTAEMSADSYLTEHDMTVKSHQKKLAEDSSLSYTDLENRYQSMHTKTIDSISKHYLTKGISIESSYSSSENGFIAYQLEQNSLTNKNGDSDWVLVDSIEEYNRFEFIANIDSLTGTSNPNESNTFNLKISNEGTVKYIIYFYKNSSDEGVIQTDDETGTTQFTCTFTKVQNSNINILGESVNSNGCESLSVIENGDTITIQNGNKLQSSFIFKGKGNMTNKTDSLNYYSDTSTDYPQRTRILYSVTNSIQYSDMDSVVNQSRSVTVGDIYDI